MKKTITILLFALIFPVISFAQSAYYDASKVFTIGFYNVENLFDTINDLKNTGDDEFLPTSEKKWDGAKYKRKINDIGKVISSWNVNELPEIVGFAELENSAVLEDLIKSQFIEKGNYKVVHKESPDARGIDVGLIYRADEFKLISVNTYALKMPDDPAFTTRDILYVKGQIVNADTLHVFVNHWSSRRGGVPETEPKRMASAKIVREKVDSIFSKNTNAKIVIVGDLNDEPINVSINNVLNATNNQRAQNPLELYNTMYDKHINKKGTNFYNGNWTMIDNIIVSQALLNSKKGFILSSDGGQIYKEKWILYDNPKVGDFTPNRIFVGNNYVGGISDHLPVFIMLKK